MQQVALISKRAACVAISSELTQIVSYLIQDISPREYNFLGATTLLVNLQRNFQRECI